MHVRKSSHAFGKAAIEAIGLGMYNYSDVTKSAGKTLSQAIESDLSVVFGASPADIKQIRSEKTNLGALWQTILGFGAGDADTAPAEPQWMSEAADYS